MFESTRLVYRTLNEADFDLFYELNSDEEVMKYTYLDRLSSREDAMKAFQDILLDQRNPEKGTQYVVSLKGTNIPIGFVDYEVVLNHAQGGIFEIGYFMKKRYWGQGFGTEMGRAFIDYLFGNFPIHKVIASVNSKNSKSEGVIVKLGMTKEGVFKKVRYKDGRWDDELNYGLLKEEWMIRQIEGASANSSS